MAEYIVCRECESPYCKGCNLKNLEMMLRNGKFDCIINENRCINTTADIAPVVYGQWIEDHDYIKCPECGVMVKWDFTFFDIGNWNYCPNCGAKMDKSNEPEN